LAQFRGLTLRAMDILVRGPIIDMAGKDLRQNRVGEHARIKPASLCGSIP